MYDYRHGGNAAFEPGGQNILDLSANINPLGFPKGTAEAITAQIPFVTRYPDGMSSELRGAIGEWEQIEPECIFCGNGASDIIFRLPACVKPKTALLPAPTFSDYERALKSFGAKVVYEYLLKEEDFRLSTSIVRALEKHGAGMVFICNPNNPTGVLAERAEMERIISYCHKQGIYTVVDECFLDFTENPADYTVKPLLKQYENLIILKAFTKIFALPGIRLGYALCGSPSIIGGLYENGADWAVSNFAQAAGAAALRSVRSSDYMKETVSHVTKERAVIRKELDKMGFITFNSRANYLFFKNPYSFNLPDELNGLKIRIRDCGNYTGLSDGYYRVAVSAKEDNRKFIEAMNTIWNKREG